MKRKRICLALLIAMFLSVPFITGCKGSAGEEGSGRDAAEEIKYDSSEFLASVPEWNGQPYCEINGNVPEFREDEIWKTTQESLDPLDSLGRCGTANSCIGLDGMPDHERGDISDVHPTGWHKGSYAFIEGGSLYNRSHLIAYSLSGDEAIDRNLITGTSYMNRDGMNPFEISIAEYVKNTGNHVMYRVEPCFMGDELVARGVHMQAVSVEDGGEGISFNVFCYNVQPGVDIDYATGESKLNEEGARLEEELKAKEYVYDPDEEVITVALNTKEGGRKIHLMGRECAGQIAKENYEEWTGTREELERFAEEGGYLACGACKPDEELGISLPHKEK